jgi:ubiquinone/menaquinone biosynthesis C-methylase UbiE
VVHHAGDPSAMLAEMIRFVKPGGAVVAVDEVEDPYG